MGLKHRGYGGVGKVCGSNQQIAKDSQLLLVGCSAEGEAPPTPTPMCLGPHCILFDAFECLSLLLFLSFLIVFYLFLFSSLAFSPH